MIGSIWVIYLDHWCLMPLITCADAQVLQNLSSDSIAQSAAVLPPMDCQVKMSCSRLPLTDVYVLSSFVCNLLYSVCVLLSCQFAKHHCPPARTGTRTGPGAGMHADRQEQCRSRCGDGRRYGSSRSNAHKQHVRLGAPL